MVIFVTNDEYQYDVAPEDSGAWVSRRYYLLPLQKGVKPQISIWSKAH